MSKEQPTKLSIDPSTVSVLIYIHIKKSETLIIILFKIINLKAELLKKQEEFRLKKLGSSSSTSNENEYEAHKVYIFLVVT